MAKHRGIDNFYDEFDEDEKYDFGEDNEIFCNQVAINMKDIKKKYPADRYDLDWVLGGVVWSLDYKLVLEMVYGWDYRSTKLYSNGKKKLDGSLYTGTGGNVNFVCNS